MKVSTLLLLCLVPFAVMAQSPIEPGGAQLNAGFGFSGIGLPVYVGADFGVHPDITIGPQLSYRSYDEDFRVSPGLDERFRHTITVIAFNGNYHFDRLLELPGEWNVYGGLTLGYYLWSSPDDYPGNEASEMGLDLQIGGRYYFNPSWAFNLEIGGGTASGGKVGVTYLLR